jgi:hypothetical protein
MSEATNAGTKRAFDPVWCELERRHGWAIEVSAQDNPRPAMSRIPFCWQDYDNRYALAFREQNHLDEAIDGAEDDWEAILRIRHWVFTNLINGTRASIPGANPFAVLAAARTGATFFCTHFAYVFVAAAASMGFPARKLGVDAEHKPDEAGNMHGVADVWVNALRKWVCVDPNYDHHYELDGVPLNADEVGRRWQTHRGEGIQALVGPDRREVPRARRGMDGKAEACALFWHHIETRGDVFRRDGHGAKDPTVLLVDDARKQQDWYQGKPPKTFKHKRYEHGTFLITDNVDDAYPDLNAAYFELREPHKMPTYCRLEFYTPCAPNFSHYEIRVDGGEPERIEGREYPWRLHPGACSIEARTVNLAGHRGPPYSMTVAVREDSEKKPEWP